MIEINSQGTITIKLAQPSSRYTKESQESTTEFIHFSQFESDSKINN